MESCVISKSPSVETELIKQVMKLQAHRDLKSILINKINLNRDQEFINLEQSKSVQFDEAKELKIIKELKAKYARQIYKRRRIYVANEKQSNSN